MAIMALQSAATGLRALDTQLDVISNNLANANNNGFKASRVNFEDLIYQQKQQPGVQNLQGDIRPVGIEVGLGTRVSGTQLDFTQGSALVTNRPLDAYIQNAGFFQIKVLPNQGNGIAYTRTGSFFVNPDGQIVANSADGYKLDPPITVPQNTTAINITNDGRVFVNVAGNATPQEVGQIQLARFVNPQGLSQIGGNLFQQTQASGVPIVANPGTDGMGTLQSGALEASNVDPTTELVNLIKTQRTFELNSKTIQASDEMMQTISNLKR